MNVKTAGQPESLKEIVLFPFDDYALPLQRGVRLHLNSYRALTNRAPIAVGLGGPGEPDSLIAAYYGSVKRVGDELWMWYCGQGDDVDDKWHQRLCIAKSKDGRNWEKPNLGLVEYNGSKSNNLIEIDVSEHIQACVVYYEPDDSNPDRRFKMLFETARYSNMLAVAFSADGLHWKLHPGNPVGPIFEEAGGTKFNGVYYINGQGLRDEHWSPSGFARLLMTYCSYDFEHWYEASCMSMRRDALPPRPTLYGINNGPQVHLGAALWNRGNTLIGFYGMWDGHPSNDRRLMSMNLGLVVSHDAMHFREPIPDFPIVDAAEIRWKRAYESPINFNYPALIQGQGFENVGDETLFWYAPWPEQSSDGIRVASWPKDRLGYFSPFHGPDSKAHVTSQPIFLEGKTTRILLNIDGLSEDSRIKVSILDEKLNELSDYSCADSLDLLESGFRQVVRWRNHDSVQSEEPIRVRVDFEGRRPEEVKLYAIYLEQ